MTIEIRPENYYWGMWYASHEKGDLMGAAWKEPGGNWILRFRFRTYKDDRVFDSEDTKSWYELRAKDGEDKTMEEMQHKFTAILAITGVRANVQSLSFIPCKGYGEDFAKICLNPERPYMHTKWLEPGEEP